MEYCDNTMEKVNSSAVKMWIHVQTRFNLFVSKLCLSEETRSFPILQTYKRKMSNMLQPPDISLYKEEEVPAHLREVAILTGYRSPSSSIKDCALSVFVPTNETLNFWTHFIPTFYFVYQLMQLWDVLKVITDAYYWPFAIYMFTISLYPLISALAHTFCSVSDMARHIWFFLDYGTLSVYAYGSGLLVRAYIFPQELMSTNYGNYFMEILMFWCIACSILACFSRFIDNLLWIKIFRLGAFALPWCWDAIPVVYRLLYSVDIDETTAEHFYLHYFFSFCIGFFYASHLPERLAPGKFDFLGNSHQLLHISGICATYHQMSAALLDMKSRQSMLQNHPFPSYWSVHVFLLLLFSITATIVIFTMYAQHYENNRKDLKREN